MRFCVTLRDTLWGCHQVHSRNNTKNKNVSLHDTFRTFRTDLCVVNLGYVVNAFCTSIHSCRIGVSNGYTVWYTMNNKSWKYEKNSNSSQVNCGVIKYERRYPHVVISSPLTNQVSIKSCSFEQTDDIRSHYTSLYNFFCRKFRIYLYRLVRKLFWFS